MNVVSNYSHNPLSLSAFASHISNIKRFPENISLIIVETVILMTLMKRMQFKSSQVKSSQKCFIAILETVYIDQNNKTKAHSGLFVRFDKGVW